MLGNISNCIVMLKVGENRHINVPDPFQDKLKLNEKKSF